MSRKEIVDPTSYFSVEQYDLWATRMRAQLVRESFMSRTAPVGEKQVLKVSDLLLDRGGGTHELRYRGGGAASVEDQREGRLRLWAVLVESIDTSKDKGMLLNTLSRECKTVAYPEGDGLKAWQTLARKANVSENATRIAAARRRINDMRSQRMPDGVTVDEFDRSIEEFQSLNAKLPTGVKETGTHLSNSLIDLMPSEADERVDLMRERIDISGGDLSDVIDVVGRLRDIIEALQHHHRRRDAAPKGALAATKEEARAKDLSDINALLPVLEALLASKATAKATQCPTCGRAHRGPCYVNEPHLMHPKFPGREAVMARRKELGKDTQPGSWESRGCPSEPTRKARPKLAATAMLAASAQVSEPDPPGIVKLVVDSGAEAHFIHDALLMSTMDSSGDYGSVRTASGEHVPIAGMGSAEVIVMGEDGGEMELTLSPAYFVPQLGMNLFSVAAAEARGVHTRFEGENVLWAGLTSDPTRVPFSRADNSYVIAGKICDLGSPQNGLPAPPSAGG